MSDLGNPRRKKRPLSHETGFWRNIGERGKLHESDVFRLREDLKRMQEIVDLVGGGELPKELASELQQIQMQVERDFGTMTLAL
jgi:hypothetical protein